MRLLENSECIIILLQVNEVSGMWLGEGRIITEHIYCNVK